MFKVAYPGATEDEEAREMDWVSQGTLSAVLILCRSGARLTLETQTGDEIAKLFDSLVNGE